jgi:hypothetical protein
LSSGKTSTGGIARGRSTHVQDGAYLLRKGRDAERLADKVDVWLQNSMMDDGILRIAGTIKNLEARIPFNQHICDLPAVHAGQDYIGKEQPYFPVMLL